MDTGFILVLSGVCITFLVFAFVLAWADHTVSQWLRAKSPASQPSNAAKRSNRKAA